MLDVEGLQRRTDISIPNQINEPMHDAHEEVGLNQGHDIEPLQEQVANLIRRRWREKYGSGHDGIFHNV